MKQKIEIQIAGISFSIVTDDDEDFALKVASRVDRDINSLVLKTPSCTKAKAAILVAMDYCSDAEKLKKENQLLKDKLEQLKKSGANEKPADNRKDFKA